MKKLYINFKTLEKKEHLNKTPENRGGKINKIKNKPQQVKITN